MKNHQGFETVGDDYARPAGFAEHGTGYVPRDYQAFPMNGLKCAQAPTIKRLSEQEIVELAIEKTAKKTWVTDLADRVGSIVKNQGQAPYCFAHAPVRGMEYARIHQGGTMLVLSAFYAAWLVKHGRKEGGSGIQVVKALSEHGTCVEELVPPQTFHVNETAEIKTNAGLHQITVWEDFEPDDTQLQMSSVVQDQPFTVGIPAWGHEVLVNFLAFTNKSGKPTFGDLCEGFDNSWDKEWGKNGRGVLAGTKRKFDEAGRIAAIEQSVA